MTRWRLVVKLGPAGRKLYANSNDSEYVFAGLKRSVFENGHLVVDAEGFNIGLMGVAKIELRPL